MIEKPEKVGKACVVWEASLHKYLIHIYHQVLVIQNAYGLS